MKHPPAEAEIFDCSTIMRLSWAISELILANSAEFEAEEDPPAVSSPRLLFRLASLLCRDARWAVSWRVFACSRLSIARLSWVCAASIRVVELAVAQPETLSAAKVRPTQQGRFKSVDFIADFDRFRDWLPWSS